MKLRNMLKKTLAVVLAFAMVAPVMANLEANVKEVKANSTTAVSDDSLNVKFQVTQGIVTETDIAAYKGKYVMRVVTSVENPDAYDALGFKVMKFGDDVSNAKTAKVKTVFKRIESTTGSTDTEKETYTYSPKVIAINGEYFATAKIVIDPDNVNQDYVVWAYGTQNGQRKEGSKRVVRVTDGLDETKTLNISFDTTSDVAVGDVLEVTYGPDANANTHNTTATVIAAYPAADGTGTVVSVRTLDEIKDNLKSANKFVFKKSETEVGNTVVRNHTIKYDGSNADTSWYDVQADATVFTIATSADLFGLASIVNNAIDLFETDKIYVISDIAVRKENVNNLHTIQPDYPWTAIGTSTNYFKGTFDAQMHTLSGLYSNNISTSYQGLFGYTKNAYVQKLKLNNCYFAGKSNIGSVSGYDAGGTFTEIYSQANVYTSQGNYIGGIVGLTSHGTKLENCWFAGTVQSEFGSNNGDQYMGGLVGAVNNGTVTVENCLNTGNVISSHTKTSMDGSIGGIVGGVQSNKTLTIKSCLNTGSVSVVNNGTNVTKYYGGIVGTAYGIVDAPTEKPSYTTTEACSVIMGKKDDDDLKSISEAECKGFLISNDIKNAFDTNVWTLDSGYTPILKCFESSYIDDSWYKPDSDIKEYVLYDAADLYGFSRLSQTYNFEGITIRLGADITVNDVKNVANWGTQAPERYWLPIGKATAFRGTFDGYNVQTSGVYSVNGIYLTSTVDDVGMFSQTAATAKIKNFKLNDSYFYSSNNYLGSVAGVGNGTFQNVYSNATVNSAKSYTGGLIGFSGSTGILRMERCWFDGNVTAQTYLGALLGRSKATTIYLYDCLNTGNVTSAKSDGTFIGGLVGRVESTNRAFSRLVNTGELSYQQESNNGHIMGHAGTSGSFSTFYSVEKTGTAATPKNGVQIITKDEISGNNAKTKLTGFDFTNTWRIVEDGPAVLNFENLDEYIVADADELQYISTLSQTTNFEGKTVKLANDIDLNGTENNQWTPISNQMDSKGEPALPFAGTFDGQGHKISNVYISSEDEYIGLFAAVAPEAVIKHFTLDDSSISSTKRFVGAIAGTGKGTYSDIYVDADVTGLGRVGGFIGLSEKSGALIMSNCSFNGTATCTGSSDSNRVVGGLVGFVSGGSIKISNCLNSGTIDATAYELNDSADGEEPYVRPLAGGLVGFISGPKSVDIVSCLNVGDILVTGATTGVGPIVGAIHTDPVEHLSIIATYATTCDDKSGVEGVTMVDADVMKNDATSELDLLDWENQWKHEQGTFPQVRFSCTGFVEPASWEVQAALLDSLSSVYP